MEAIKADEEKVGELCSMGFSADQARQALVRCANDVNLAASYLLDSSQQLIPYSAADPIAPATPPPQRPSSPAQPPSNNPTVQRRFPHVEHHTATAMADADLQEGIARSLQQTKTPAASVATANADSDTDIQRAIMESLTVQEEVADPNALRRSPDMPVGLMNVGNTCYFNSLLQLYFSIPEFRQAVFDFDVAADQPALRPPLPLSPSPSLPSPGASRAATEEDQRGDERPEDVRRQQLIEFMRSLQEVFALMQQSSKSYIDASSVLKHLRDPEGNAVKIGDQEDVMQFNDIFLQYVDRGLQLALKPGASPHASPCKGEPVPSLVERLFYGTKEDTFCDSSGKVHHKATDRFSQVVLQVSDGLAVMADSLEYDTTPNEVDGYTTEGGEKILARKYTWFRDLPPFLIFQLRRVDFDRRTQQLRKILLPFEFPDVLCMDPYCAHNAPVILERRRRVDKLKEARAKAEKDYSYFANFAGQPFGLNSVLASTVKFLDQQENASSLYYSPVTDSLEGVSYDVVANIVDNYSNDVNSRMQGMQADIMQLKEEIQGVFADMRNEEYSLHSVLVHGGVHATHGHYWAFIPCASFGYPPGSPPAPMETDTDTNTTPAKVKAEPGEPLDWFLFNDKVINKVPASKMRLDGSGGQRQTDASAYCLVYARHDLDLPTQVKRCSKMPQWLQDKVAAHNKALEAKCLEHNQAKIDQSLVLQLNTQFRYVENLVPMEVSEHSPNFDPRFMSFSAFLRHSWDFSVEDIRYCCLAEAYTRAFPHSDLLRDLQIGQETPEGRRAHIIMWHLEASGARLKNVISRIPDYLRLQFKFFQETARYYWQGLVRAEEGRWEQALQALLLALFKDGEKALPQAHLDSRIRRAIAYVLKKYFDEVCTQMEEDHADLDVLLARVACIAVQHRQHLGYEQGIWMYLVCKWILKQETFLDIASGHPDWTAQIQDITLLLTQPDTPDVLAFAAPLPPLAEGPDAADAPPETVTSGICEAEKVLFPKYKAEEINVRFHTSSMIDLPAGTPDSGQ